MQLDTEYKYELSFAKKTFYKKKIKNLKKKNPSKWYKELKKLSNFDLHKSEDIVVESLKHFLNKEQAEIIADQIFCG